MRILNAFIKESLKGLTCGALLFVTGVSAFAQTTTDAFTTVGTHTWIVPQGVTSITLEAWGAGGGGGGTESHVLTYSPRAGGGGGGAYSQIVLNVTPGEELTIEVGAGGIGGNAANDGMAGQFSSISILGTTILSAEGGQGGAYRTNDNQGTASGLGGASGIGFMYAGGAGGAVNNTDFGSGGGGAGGSNEAGSDGTPTAFGAGGNNGGGNGGIATTAADQNGHPGSAPGGGGGGSSRALLAGSNQGGEGARGEVRITYCPLPAQIDFISGEETPCEGTVQNYSVINDPTVTEYIWTLPSNWSGASTSNTIGVMTGGASGTITVEAVNGCGASVSQTLTIATTPLPSQPSSIIGNPVLCEGTSLVYSVTNDPTVDTYVWTLPADWTGSSDSNSIEVTAGNTSGTITVTTQNACGNSPVRILNVSSLAVPAQPSTITGEAILCQGTSSTYQVTVDPMATSYTWTLPTDWTGTSTSNTISITAGETSGTITVAAINQCGASINQTLAVSLNLISDEVTLSGNTLTATQSGAVYQWINCATGAPIAGGTQQSFSPSQPGEYKVLVFTPENCSAESACITVSGLSIDKNIFESVSIFPNPATNNVNISNLPSGSTIKMMDMTGKVIYSTQFISSTENIDLFDVKAGVYFLNIENKSGAITKKLVVKK